MNNIRINNEISLNYPEGSKDMNEAELARYFGSAQNRWGVYDDARHIILSVSWTKAGFKRMLADAESMLIDIEGRLCRTLVNYQRLTSYQYKFKKIKAYGIRFEYRVNDVARVLAGDLVVFKYKKQFYAIHYLTRMNDAPENIPLFKEILDSVTIG